MKKLWYPTLCFLVAWGVGFLYFTGWIPLGFGLAVGLMAWKEEQQ